MSDQPRQNRRSWQNLDSQSLFQGNLARSGEPFKAVHHRLDNYVCRVIINRTCTRNQLCLEILVVYCPFFLGQFSPRQ